MASGAGVVPFAADMTISTSGGGNAGPATVIVTVKPKTSTSISGSGVPLTLTLTGFTVEPHPSASTGSDESVTTLTLKPQPSASTYSTITINGDGEPVTLTVKSQPPASTRGIGESGSVIVEPENPTNTGTLGRLTLKAKRRASTSSGSGDPGRGNSAAVASSSSASSSSNANMVYQFKISLGRNFKPPIWRRVQVPEAFTFREIHQTIQCLFGWSGQHMHQFKMGDGKRPKYDHAARADPEAFLLACQVGPCRPRGDFLIKDYFKMDGERKAIYEYDLGSTWYHDIFLEKILPVKVGTEYPLCTDGRSRTPPEDPTESEWEEYESDPHRMCSTRKVSSSISTIYLM